MRSWPAMGPGVACGDGTPRVCVDCPCYCNNRVEKGKRNSCDSLAVPFPHPLPNTHTNTLMTRRILSSPAAPR